MSICSSPDLPGQPLASDNKLSPNSPPPLLHDRYHILKLLGQGRFSKTFLAVDEGLPVQCVVKQLLPSRSVVYQEALTFQQEAQRFAELGEHSQIPKLLDAFEQDGNPFIVQEWIEGETLEQEIASSAPFSEAEVRQVLQELLPVLQYLHDRQIIHRDIKPANIIRRKFDRQLVLVDFGTAEQIISPIQTETLVGSVEYAAPEQIKGQAVFASDLYSLGLTCLYLLTQTSPFDLYDIVENDWKWQAYLPQSVSSELKIILCKLLQPALRRRYQLAAEVLTDLSASAASVTGQQVEDAIDNASTKKTLSSKTDPLSDLNQIAHCVKATCCTGATVYLPQTRDWYYLPVERDTSGQSTAFFFSPRLAAASASRPVQDIPLFTLKQF